MSRVNTSVKLSVGLLLAASASLAWAQGWNSNPNAEMGELQGADMNDGKMLDLSQPSFSDPAAVDMLFKEGNTIASILDGLNDKGFHIEYREKQFTEEMTLLSLPTATKIDDVLTEILEPWNFRVFRSPMGKLIVTQGKKKKAPTWTPDTTQKKR